MPSGAHGKDQSVEFCIDSPSITPAERDFFVYGYEYAQLHAFLHVGSTTAWPRPVHSANEFRLRALVSRYRRTYQFTPSEDPEWVIMDVGPVPEPKEE